MKKLLISLLLVSSAVIVFADDLSVTFTKTFLSRLPNCIPYKETRNLEISGEKLSVVQQIKGWQNGKCTYLNYPIGYKGISTTCHFTKSQIAEIIAATKRTGTETYSENGITYTSNNPVDIVMTKFTNDGTTCTFSND